MARKETTLEQDAYIRKHGAEMSASEIQRAIGLSRKIVKRRADEMKVALKKGKPPGVAPAFDWDSVDWSQSNRKIAEQLGCSYVSVKTTRAKRDAGPGARAENRSRGISREYKIDHLQKIKANAAIGRARALSSPLASKHPDNIHAKEWALASPDDQVYRIRNLYHFIRTHAELFDPSDIVWKRSGAENDTGSGVYCNASVGITGVKAGRSRQWKGWRLLEPKEKPRD